MEDILKQANDIIGAEQKSDRKQEAFTLFCMYFALSGLMVSMAEGPERGKAGDEMIERFSGYLVRAGFVIRAREHEIEANFKLLHLMVMMENRTDTPEGAEQFMRESFDKLFWNKCIFDSEVSA